MHPLLVPQLFHAILAVLDLIRSKVLLADVLHVARYGNYADMFLKLLKDSNDELWDVYFVFEKDSPPDEVLANYEVSLGSGLSVNDLTEPFQNVLTPQAILHM